jgi:hypothetical protein
MPDPAPHRHLYARLGVTQDKGIGVVAIRDIPAGMNPFAGDEGKMVRVPVAEVEAIPDGAIRTMYVDFCPVQDGAYHAPADFNLLTTGWYMNHSDHPNVAAEGDLAFLTTRNIAKGEELTVDYATFSDGAARKLAERKGAP